MGCAEDAKDGGPPRRGRRDMRWRALLVDARHVDRPVRAKNARLDAGARLANRYTPQGFWREALFQSASREKILSRATPGVTEPEIKRLRRGDMRLRGIDGRDSRLPSKAKFPPQRNQTVDSRFTASLVIVNTKVIFRHESVGSTPVLPSYLTFVHLLLEKGVLLYSYFTGLSRALSWLARPRARLLGLRRPSEAPTRRVP